MTNSMAPSTTFVTIGVDTHKDFHVAAALDPRGALYATESLPAIAAGYQALSQWADSFGTVNAFGVEGTSSWGAGLARHLAGENRADPAVAIKIALVHLARRHQQLSEEIDTLRGYLDELIVIAPPPELLADKGVGTDSAAALIIAAGDNPHRMHSQAAFASLCGVSRVDASSGKQLRHRLNRGGNREANQALWRIVFVKMSCDPVTQKFIAERISRGKTKREAMRILKRHLARRYWNFRRDRAARAEPVHVMSATAHPYPAAPGPRIKQESQTNQPIDFYVRAAHTKRTIPTFGSVRSR